MSKTTTALEIATEVLNEEVKPSLRKMIRSLLQSVKEGQATKSAYARFAAVMGLGDVPVPSADKIFDGWQESVVWLCQAFVKSGLIDRDDDVFAGFDF